MKQTGFLYELRPTDYILGSTSPLKGEELNPEGDWRQWAPAEEKQYDFNFDTMSCTTFSGTSTLEALFNFFLEKKKFSGTQEKWLRDEGYIENGKFNFSDRFSATVNGTTPQGQYFQNAWDSFRKDGLIPERDHPFGGNNQAEYLDKNKITEAMRAKAKKFLELIIENEGGGYKLNYEWVPVTATGVELNDSFKQAPIQVAVTKESPTHAILLLKMDWEWESYPPYLRPRNRTVAYALKTIVKIKAEAPVPTDIVWKGSPHFYKGRSGQKPEAIVIHIMDGTLKGTDAWFNDPVSKVSSHYGVGKKGEKHQYVKEEDGAWANGGIEKPTWKLLKTGVNPNFYTISIEHEGDADDKWTPEMKNASVDLIKDICKRWQIPIDREHIIGHYEINGGKKINCPAKDKGIIDELIAMAKGQAQMPPEVALGIKKVEEGIAQIKQAYL